MAAGLASVVGVCGMDKQKPWADHLPSSLGNQGAPSLCLFLPTFQLGSVKEGSWYFMILAYLISRFSFSCLLLRRDFQSRVNVNPKGRLGFFVFAS